MICCFYFRKFVYIYPFIWVFQMAFSMHVILHRILKMLNKISFWFVLCTSIFSHTKKKNMEKTLLIHSQNKYLQIISWCKWSGKFLAMIRKYYLLIKFKFFGYTFSLANQLGNKICKEIYPSYNFDIEPLKVLENLTILISLWSIS